MININAPKFVIFDWDNTLVNSWPSIHFATNKLFVSMGIDKTFSLDEVKANAHRSSRDSFPELFGDRAPEAIELFSQYADQARDSAPIDVISGAQNTIELLKASGLPMAISSNKRGDALRYEVEHLGWGKYFEFVYGSGDLEFDKPNPQVVSVVTAGVKINDTKDVWFVGDSIVDMDCGNSAGCTCILFGDKKAAHSIDKTQIQYHHTSTHQELQTLITDLNQI